MLTFWNASAELDLSRRMDAVIQRSSTRQLAGCQIPVKVGSYRRSVEDRGLVDSMVR